MKIGFVGLGLMGRPMALRLLDAGHALYVYSSNVDSMNILIEKGATPAASVAELADRVDVFCSCRVTAEQSREVFLGPDGVMSADNPALLCIDFSTIDPATARAIGAAMLEQGIDYLDAPVSGGPDAAAKATLSVIVGGEAKAVERARPLFEAFGKRTFHMGGTGSGVTTKLCNNMISITTHALVAEAMVLGVKGGVDAHALYEALSNSSAYSRTLERVVPNHFLPRNFKAAATIDTIMKDLRGAIDLADQLGFQLRLPETAMRCFVDAAQSGHGQSDIASVIIPMEKRAATTVGRA